MDQLAFFENEPLLPNALFYQKEMFGNIQSNNYLNFFIDTVPWQQKSVLMYGKEVVTPRLTAWFGDGNADYSISGSGAAPLPWTNELLEIRD